MEDFESVTCPRCDGSGNHSSCETWGTTCFKCGTQKGIPGRGVVYTKRGQAAKEFEKSLLSKAVADLTAGDVIWDRLSGWNTVVALAAPCYQRLNDKGETYNLPGECAIECKGRIIGTMLTNLYSVRAKTQEERLAIRGKALAYQATLKKDGKPYQRAPRLAA